MPCRSGSDPNGIFYIVDPEKSAAQVAIWWNRTKRTVKGRAVTDEKLIIKQVNGEKADVIELEFGQAYDVIDALNRAVENRK